MSSTKKPGFNIFKKNIISPFKACLNMNNYPFSTKNKVSKIMKAKKDNSYISSTQKKSYISLISTKNTKNSSSLFLDHTFMASKNLVLYKLQNKSLFLSNTLNNPNNINKDKILLNRIKNKKKEADKPLEDDINIKSYLKDLKKTFDLNLDIINKIYDKNKDIRELIIKVKNKIKNKEDIEKKIEKIKSVMIIEKQIQSEYIRKKGENEKFNNEQINLNLDKITMKEEYIIVLMKKLRELEIFSKRKSSIPGSGFHRYKNFKIADFVDINTKYYYQKNLLFNEIKNIKNNIKKIKIENNNIKNKQEKMQKLSKFKKEENIKKFEKYYNYGINMIEYKIKILKNIMNRISEKYIYIKISPKLKSILERKDDNENIFEININTNKNYKNKNKRSLMNSISASIDLTNMNNDMSKRLESFIDLSIILNDNKNNEVTNIFDTINHGNIYVKKADFGNVSKMK